MITTFSSLLQNVIQISEDDGAEFASYIPTAVQIAEERLYKELDLPDLETTVVTNCNQGAVSVPLPNTSDMLEFILAKDLATGESRILQKKNVDFIEDYWPDPNEQEFPKYWAWSIKGPFFSSTGVKTPTDPTVRLVPTPNVPLSLSYRGYAKPPLLAQTNQRNYFTEKCPQILFAAVMVEMAKFMKAWSQVSIWDADYNGKASAWNINMSRFRGDGQQANQNPVPAENNLKSKSKTTT